MTEMICLHSKGEVEAFCRKKPYLHLYALGDLDDFFWPKTTWYALCQDGDIQELVLMYVELNTPVVLALADQPIESMRELLRRLTPVLPRRFYAHLTESAADALASDYRIQAHGTYMKMGLIHQARLGERPDNGAAALSPADEGDLLAMYAASYPGNCFNPRMLETGCCFGIRRGGELVSVAGVHVVSRKYKVAALGNIATLPAKRARGLAAAVTATLCRHLLNTGIEQIGLNVKADNQAAIACYEKLGFEKIAEYGEYTLDGK
jgi:RimJ/RimL family protein N-acetyltransferase